MTRSPANLFKPFTVGSLTVPNRIVMAPMTRSFSPGGVPGPDVATYYRLRAEQDCGLIITEGTTVECPVAGGYPDVPHFWGDALPGWRRVVEEVHSVGGRIIPQLWHVGMSRDPSKAPSPELKGIGPSGIGKKLEAAAEPMTRQQMTETIDAFVRAAYSAREVGFDGVELHGAHGYLIDQFFWSKTNLRDDEYGGSIERRVQFGVDLVSAVRKEIGDDFPLLLRISQFKGIDYAAKIAETPEELGSFLKPLAAAGVDVFDCSQRRFWEPEFEGSSLNLAGWVKKLSGKPTITVGSVSLSGDFISGILKGENATVMGIEGLLERLDQDEFDLVAVGRALITDPGWARKIKEERYDDLLPFSSASLATLA